MNPERTKPVDCRTMAEVRAGIDRVDDQIIALLGERFRYMDAAARIKTDRNSVRNEKRKAEVIAHVRARAEAEKIPAERVVALYDWLIEGSIVYELEQFDALKER
jgi:isochorismate pyruvate lyase